MRPFSSREVALFCGRRREKEILVANLRASPLTLVYGESGAGKSSLLQAGVGPGLAELAAERHASGNPAGFTSMIFGRWSGDPLASFAIELHRRVVSTIDDDARAVGECRVDNPVPAPGDGRLHVLTQEWADRVGRVLIVLDQFEDYFVHHTADGAPDEFARELAELINDEKSRVHVMISLRADALGSIALRA